MQKIVKTGSGLIKKYFLLVVLMAAILPINNLLAQDSTATQDEPVEPVAKTKSYTKSTFEGNYIIHDQTVMVPIKGTFEFDINHRFGTTNHSFTDLYGLFAGANMCLGFSYTPVKNLQVGFAVCNYNMQVDWDVKYAILKQTKNNAMPVSVTYYGNVAMDTRKRNSSLPIVTFSDRLSYFNQLMVARKFTPAFSAQASFSVSYFNNVPGYYDDQHVIHPEMKNAHLAMSFSGRYKISPKTGIIVSYDQPLTQHPMNNPHPNLSVGLDMRSSGHDFQVFIGNYGYTLPQDNNVLNQNDYRKGEFVIGFNISRLWNF